MMCVKSRYIGICTMIISLTVLASCSFDPIDKTYNKHTADDDYRRIVEISSIDSLDAVLLGNYMIEHNLVSQHIRESHATYKEILGEAKREKEKYEIERRKKGKKEIDIAKSHEIEKIKNIRKVLFVDFVKQEEFNDDVVLPKPKKTPPPPSPNLITYDVMFKNIGEKDIKAFKGEVNFYDIFHNEIKKTSFTSFQQINSGDSIVQRFTINLTEVNQEGKIFNDLKKDYIKVEWLPDRLIHTDDEVIE